ncbi:hypothetical protein SELMODRAFT_134883 [Selaginella moellendorffii]|uniref:NAD-dependent epimerase/dehydratase domain-containing protein n=2 Tax=Selaginella moellendorffii TaxID=88036 RepID=D8T9B4_SELML|nr:hypothetical protein SELMODRAFT_134989 [Selaginella moellendorffii]EFJ06723.1 hypothetical protein SELMODRAFT_134883 [Selaginella moellendorffii]
MAQLRGMMVCVTGASGFIGSWIVKYLLDKGYTVRGAVRDPEDLRKVEHLKNLKGANQRLELVKADLLDNSLVAATAGCQVVIHTACPCPEANFRITNPQTELIEPSVKGTLNVLKASFSSGVSTVVMTSSVGAMYLDPTRPLEQPVDESCWSDVEYLVQIKEWYCLAKTLAEKSAWEFAAAQGNGFKLIVINPAVVMGPVLQPKLNASSTHILKYLTGCVKSYANRCQAYVDVRDVALAHVAAFEDPKAFGRYFLAERSIHRARLVEMLAELYPQLPVPKICSDTKNPEAVPYKICNAKARQLLESELINIGKCLFDSVESFKEKGFL